MCICKHVWTSWCLLSFAIIIMQIFHIHIKWKEKKGNVSREREKEKVWVQKVGWAQRATATSCACWWYDVVCWDYIHICLKQSSSWKKFAFTTCAFVMVENNRKRVGGRGREFLYNEKNDNTFCSDEYYFFHGKWTQKRITMGTI